MRAVFSGTRLRPAVELNFSFYAAHPVTGQPLREWIRDIPGRAWVPERKTWTVTALGATPDKTLTDAGFTTVVGPDDEPMSLAGYTAPLVAVDPEHPGFLCVYPRLAGQFTPPRNYRAPRSGGPTKHGGWCPCTTYPVACRRSSH